MLDPDRGAQKGPTLLSKGKAEEVLTALDRVGLWLKVPTIIE